MKTKDCSVVLEARAAAKHSMAFFDKMMEQKRANNMDTEVKKRLFVVDAISTFRNRYVVEAESLEHAYDEVSMIDSTNSADSFEPVTQRFLGESIIDGREIKEKEFNKLLKAAKKDTAESCSYWMGKNLIRKINYGE